jgi:hypothetical protein
MPARIGGWAWSFLNREGMPMSYDQEQLAHVADAIVEMHRKVYELYPAHARTRKSWGEMIRKLSVTSSQ